MSFVNAYLRMVPLDQTMPDLVLSGDIAGEWNDRIDMKAWGARIGAAYTARDLPLTQTFSYNFYTMSGDDPFTSGYEGFDPLFNSGSDWMLGSNSALVFANSNVNVNRIGVDFVLSPQDFFKAKYFHIRSNQIQSPIPVDPSYVPSSGVNAIEGLSREVANDLMFE